MSWKLLEHTRKAAIWEGEMEGDKAFLVTIGMGKKLPTDFSLFPKRDNHGFILLKNSHWTYRVTSLDRYEPVKQHALNLYHHHC